jgi:hypothetical protein
VLGQGGIIGGPGKVADNCNTESSEKGTRNEAIRDQDEQKPEPACI